MDLTVFELFGCFRYVRHLASSPRLKTERAHGCPRYYFMLSRRTIDFQLCSELVVKQRLHLAEYVQRACATPLSFELSVAFVNERPCAKSVSLAEKKMTSQPCLVIERHYDSIPMKARLP